MAARTPLAGGHGPNETSTVHASDYIGIGAAIGGVIAFAIAGWHGWKARRR
ncbi:hypothetical protein ACKI14_02555 [Streptomyces turgidiscabies]|uniref:hypothetical protein n=1 Tax=Streptomyces turgidiscabies TaxID=85558 RepID=UPI0038F6B135